MYFNLIQQGRIPGECLEIHDHDIILNKILTGRNLYAQAWGIIIIENCMK